MILTGLNQKAIDYIDEHSVYIEGKHIGCKKSDGIINKNAVLHKIEKLDNGTFVCLFEYSLNNGKKCWNKVQTIKDDYIFISLLLDTGKEIKWTKEEINNFINKQ